MSRRFSIPILLAPALLLAGCDTARRGLESASQPVVSRADYSFDLTLAGYSLAPGEDQRLAGWLSSLRLGYGDRIAIDDGGNGGAARDQIAAAAGRYGLLLSNEVPVTTGAVAPGTVRVVVTRLTATVPDCPNFSDPDTNYGCAVNSNLAAMVANPGDLVRGQPGSGTVDPATAGKAINTFRNAAPTGAGGLKADSAGSGGGQ